MSLTLTLILFGCLALSFFFFIDAFMNYMRRRSARRALFDKSIASAKRQEMPLTNGIKKPEDSSEDMALDKYLKNLLMLADNPMSLKRLYIIIAGVSAPIAAFFYFYLPFIPLVLALVVAAFCGFFIIVLQLKSQCKKRNEKFEELFPDALELIIRSLRIGQPLNTAIRAVADEVPDPVGKEFSIVSREVAYGRDLPDSIESMLQRITIADLRFFVVAIQIQHESGGNLAEVLDGLSKIIRGRARLQRKVKALTVEGRFSAWFLSAFPVFMIVVMNSTNPGYYLKVADFVYFKHLVVLTMMMLLVNVVAMRMMTKIKV